MSVHLGHNQLGLTRAQRKDAAVRLRVFVDWVRVHIGIDPLYATITRSELLRVEPQHTWLPSRKNRETPRGRGWW